GLTQNPPVGDIKAIKEYSDGRLRLRVGKYRVIYRYDLDGRLEILLVIDIDSRGGIYKRKGR
ncbi:MAG: type II toxin-antitoxin system RelE/ParE family toxin, partial [Oscillibacter sp.]|nr:type II toxin-antitoxin system RelE/ParE family toxin [Oscillibacter sp.]